MFQDWMSAYDYVTERGRSLVAEARREHAAAVIRARRRDARSTARSGGLDSAGRPTAAARGSCRECPSPAGGGAAAA
jgi:hypothetical protein